jgi:hypothetical protein
MRTGVWSDGFEAGLSGNIRGGDAFGDTKVNQIGEFVSVSGPIGEFFRVGMLVVESF